MRLLWHFCRGWAWSRPPQSSRQEPRDLMFQTLRFDQMYKFTHAVEKCKAFVSVSCACPCTASTGVVPLLVQWAVAAAEHCDSSSCSVNSSPWRQWSIDLSGEAQTSISSWHQWSRVTNHWIKTPMRCSSALELNLRTFRLLFVPAFSVGDTMI